MISFFPYKEYTILSNHSIDDIYLKLDDKTNDKGLDLDVYLKLEANRRFADQTIKNSLSIDSRKVQKGGLWFVNYHGTSVKVENQTRLDIKIEFSRIAKLLFLIWFGMAGLVIIVDTIYSILFGLNIFNPVLIILLMLVGSSYAGMHGAMVDHERKSKEVFLKLCDGEVV